MRHPHDFNVLFAAVDTAGTVRAESGHSAAAYTPDQPTTTDLGT